MSAAGGYFQGTGHESELNGLDVQFVYEIDCHPDGSSTVSWSTSIMPQFLIGYGDTSYRESGTITIGPNVFDEQDREIESWGGGYWEYNRDAPILDFQASFEFDYEGVSVVGTRHSPAVIGNSVPRAACGTLWTDLTDPDGNPGDPDDRGSDSVLWFDFRLYSLYDATYTTSNGQYSQSGLALTDLDAFYDVSDGNRIGLLQSEYFTGNDPVPVSGDADGDGIEDTIDTGDGAFTNGATSGAVTDAAGHSVTVVPEGSDEVRITVTGTGTTAATVTVCGFTLRLAPGSEVVVSCGSITTQVVSGSAELVLGDGLTLVSIPAGVTATLTDNPDGSYRLSQIVGGTVTVTVDGVANQVGSGETLDLEAWDFVGFGAPVDNSGVLNVVKAGQTVPLKWRVLDVAGNPVTDLTTAAVRVSSLACTAGTSSDQLEEIAAGSSGLQNLGDGHYQLNWKTPKTYANSCKTMRLDIGDGVEHTALFRFTK